MAPRGLPELDTPVRPPAPQKVRVPKASELVASELRRQIVRGEVAEGEGLPPEAELMQRFGVSRPTLREAFRILESERLISVARGARGGARVHLPEISVAATYTGLLLQVRGTTLADVYAAQLVIEPPMARACAENRTDEVLDAMRECLDRVEEAIEEAPDDVPFYVARFHQLVVAGSGNITLSVLAGMLAHIYEQHLAAELAAKQTPEARVADHRKGLRGHRKLFDLIEKQKGAQAETFWRKHMEVAGEKLLRHGETTVVDLFD